MQSSSAAVQMEEMGSSLLVHLGKGFVYLVGKGILTLCCGGFYYCGMLSLSQHVAP